MKAIVFSLLFLVGISFGKDIKVEKIDDTTFEKPKVQVNRNISVPAYVKSNISVPAYAKSNISVPAYVGKVNDCYLYKVDNYYQCKGEGQ
jgi:hypothetical protein